MSPAGGVLCRVLRVCAGRWGLHVQRKRQYRVMNRFLSHATNRIDAKGRVSVPSMFRSVLSALDIRELYCFQDFVFPAISAGGPELLDRFERQIGGEDPFSPQANQMSLLIHGGGVFMKLDQEGRLMVTDLIRDFTGITTEVTFVGRADHFQLWAPQVFLETQAAAREERRLRGRRSD
jgi:MraZ protein